MDGDDGRRIVGMAVMAMVVMVEALIGVATTERELPFYMQCRADKCGMNANKIKMTCCLLRMQCVPVDG